ncbi:MAG: phage terminase large subunit family protein [bacterium]|nr:phage terminase large subunit family protein [bacterium]
MARDFLNAKHDGPEKLKTWINTCLGETWEESGEVINQDSLMGQARALPGRGAPAGASADRGVDVQDDRLEVGGLRLAHGRGIRDLVPSALGRSCGGSSMAPAR